VFQHQDTTRVTQPNLIAICFAGKYKLRLDSAASPLWYLDAELWIRAVRIIASYESNAWQADFSGLTAKPGVLFS